MPFSKGTEGEPKISSLGLDLETEAVDDGDDDGGFGLRWGLGLGFGLKGERVLGRNWDGEVERRAMIG